MGMILAGASLRAVGPPPPALEAHSCDQALTIMMSCELSWHLPHRSKPSLPAIVGIHAEHHG